MSTTGSPLQAPICFRCTVMMVMTMMTSMMSTIGTTPVTTLMTIFEQLDCNDEVQEKGWELWPVAA